MTMFRLLEDPPPAGVGADGNPYTSGAAAAGGANPAAPFGAGGVGLIPGQLVETMFGNKVYSLLYAGRGRTGPYGTAILGERPDGTQIKGARRRKGDKAVSTLEYLRRFQERASDDEIRQMALLLAIAGYANVDSLKQAKEFAIAAPRQMVVDLHEKFIGEAAMLYQYAQATPGAKKLTPEQYLEQQIRYRMLGQFKGKISEITLENMDSLIAQYGNGFGPEEEEPFTGTKTQTSKSVDLMSPADARGLVRGLLQNELGRDPTQAEYEDFVAALHAAQRRNPATATQTTRFVENEPVHTSVTGQKGIGVEGLQQMAYEKLRKTPGWEEWQAVGVYAPALMAALDAPVPGV